MTSLKTNLQNIKGRKILVVGLGKSGTAAAREMLRLGADVTVQDMKSRGELDPGLLRFLENQGAKLCLGASPSDVTGYDMLILSPGVTPELPFVQEAAAAGAEIVGELEIAFRISKGNFVAITGTNGKTTTTTLVGEIFANAGRKTYVVGNIGVAVISEASVSREGDWMITEVSSFQLETTKYFKPHISAILNITPDHLNRHHTFENYIRAKARVFENQSADGYFVTNHEDPVCRKLAAESPAKVVWFSDKEELPFGAFVQNGRLVFRTEEGDVIDFLAADELNIIGAHNVQNALAAIAISYSAGISPDVIADTMRSFAGVEHRLEYTAEIEGVKYYNDSKGTNTDAAATALRAVGHDIILIAGGDAKGQDFTDFAKDLAGRVKLLILLGRDRGMIREAAEKEGFTNILECRDMEECVQAAYREAAAGDSVLLSPACASWDMYDNYEQRGRHFKDCVRRLES